MPAVVQSAFESWSLPVPITFALLLTACIYARGWIRLRSAFAGVTSAWRLVAFMSGLATVWIAAGSPLAALDDALLSIHMVQHILLMAIAPPLILLGAPALPLLHGFSQRFVRSMLGPLFRSTVLQRLGRTATHPVFAWLAATLALLVWHFPAAFELGLRSAWWHEVEHASFFVTGLLFWWPVVQPWPSVARWPRWSIPVYLFLATLPCDTLSAFLAFCDRVVYPSYLSAPRLLSVSPLQDQECAGALMWACATFSYLIPAVVVTIQILSRPGGHAPEQSRTAWNGVAAQSTVASKVEVV